MPDDFTKLDNRVLPAKFCLKAPSKIETCRGEVRGGFEHALVFSDRLIPAFKAHERVTQVETGGSDVGADGDGGTEVSHRFAGILVEGEDEPELKVGPEVSRIPLLNGPDQLGTVAARIMQSASESQQECGGLLGGRDRRGERFQVDSVRATGHISHLVAPQVRVKTQEHLNHPSPLLSATPDPVTHRGRRELTPRISDFLIAAIDTSGNALRSTRPALLKRRLIVATCLGVRQGSRRVAEAGTIQADFLEFRDQYQIIVQLFDGRTKAFCRRASQAAPCPLEQRVCSAPVQGVFAFDRQTHILLNCAAGFCASPGDRRRQPGEPKENQHAPHD